MHAAPRLLSQCRAEGNGAGIVAANSPHNAICPLENGLSAAHIRGMVQVWKSGAGDDFTCPSYGAVYAVKINRLPARDTDNATCVECKQIMAEWNSTVAPSFTLKTHKDGSPA
jgi:hypothetical protein